MKKFFVFLSVIFCLSAFMLFGCNKNNCVLLDRVSYLKSDVFEGQSENFNLKAYYGFSESPLNNDGKVGTKIYALTFILDGKIQDNATYYILYENNKEEYKSQLDLSPTTDKLTTLIEIKDFNLKEFTVYIVSVSTREEIVLTSVKPQNTLSVEDTLNCLYDSQQDLFESKKVQNEFNFELTVKLLFKDQKPYYYIGIIEQNGQKALLVDGLNGEVLAIREIF